MTHHRRIVLGMVLLGARGLIVGSVLFVGLSGLTSAWAGVNVNINVGAPPPVVVAPAPPPPVVVEAPPEMVFLPAPGLYVAVGIPFDVFFVTGRYYYFHGGNWFWARGYGGPWVHVVDRSLPPGLQKYRIEKLHEFRERAYKDYRAQGPKYQGRHFVAVAKPGHGTNGHGPEHGRGHGEHAGGEHFGNERHN